MRIATIPQNLKELLGMTMGIVPTPLCDVVLGPLVANALIAASSVQLFDALNERPLTSNEVAGRCQTHPDATERLLRALYVSKYLNWGGGFYSLTRSSRRWLVSSAEESIHHAILHRNIDFRFFNFQEYLRTGTERHFHEELEDSEWLDYHRGQAAQSRLLVDELVEKVPLPRNSRRMLDLGGGQGVLSLAFCTRYEGLRSRVIDLATPLNRSLTNAEQRGAGALVTFEIGDVRNIDLGAGSADVVLVANLMHHFCESTNKNLFHRVARALTAGGIVIALDLIRAQSVAQSGQLDALMDVYFGAASGSQLWTVEQICNWQVASGLTRLPPISLRRLPACKILIARKE